MQSQVLLSAMYTGCIKKTEQILNRSQRREAAQGMKFLINIDCFGTYDVQEKILKFKCFESKGVRIFKQI